MRPGLDRSGALVVAVVEVEEEEDSETVAAVVVVFRTRVRAVTEALAGNNVK